jgi:hypothetical protein
MAVHAACAITTLDVRWIVCGIEKGKLNWRFSGDGYEECRDV